MTESAGTLRGRFKCDPKVFAPETVRCLARGFTTLLDAVVRQPDGTVAALAAGIDIDPGGPSAGTDREEIDL